MSQENVEVVRGVIEAHERGDFDTVFAAYDPEIEWHLHQLWLESNPMDFEPVYHGHEGVRTFWRVWFAAWETADFEYEEFIDAGDSVVTILSQRVRGRTSGVELDWTPTPRCGRSGTARSCVWSSSQIATRRSRQ